MGPMFWSFFAFFISCEIGEIAMETCGEFLFDFCQCDWYNFPVKMQKMLQAMILMAQEPCVIKIFGTIIVSRSTFKTVSSSVFVVETLMNNKTCK